MKKYIKPQIETEEFEIVDAITASGVFTGMTNLDKSSDLNWNDKILDPKDTF